MLEQPVTDSSHSTERQTDCCTTLW